MCIRDSRQGLRMKNRSGYRLVVAIADVSHYVRPGTPPVSYTHLDVYKRQARIPLPR